MLAHEHVQLPENLLVAPEGEITVNPVHQRGKPQLVQLRYLVPSERLKLEAREGRAAPERERVSQTVGGAIELALRNALARTRNEPVHARGVELLGAELEPVASLRGRDRVGAVARQ